MPLKVWFNKSFSSTFNVLETVREADPDRRFRLLCSHSNPEFPAFFAADEAFVEPGHLSTDDYVAYALETCRARAIDVLVVGKAMAAIAERVRDFDKLGVRLLLAADAGTLRRIEHKGQFYAGLEGTGIAIPEHRIVNTLDEFDAAYASLRSRHETVCFKPAVSVFGLGFRVLTEHGRDLDRLLAGEPHRISVEGARRLLGERPRFRDLMVMQFLEGSERSIDCLGHEGALVRAVVRRKSRRAGGGQRLEDNPALIDVAARIASRYALGGLYNVQVKESRGVSWLLEMNPRMSGGLHFASLSGVAFPYWALRLLTGSATPADVPLPRLGIHIGQINRGFVVPPRAEPS